MQNRPLAALSQWASKAHMAPRHGGEMWPPPWASWHSRNRSCTFEAKIPRYLIEMAQKSLLRHLCSLLKRLGCRKQVA